jgi:hypothetical protein
MSAETVDAVAVLVRVIGLAEMLPTVTGAVMVTLDPAATVPKLQEKDRLSPALMQTV